jgi:starch-binding outer membrane protein, SusD/RagB family
MKKIILSCLIFASVLSGCKKLLEVDSVRTVGEENMWNSLEDSRGALMGIYALSRAALIDNNAHWIYGDVRSGDFASPIRQDLNAVIKNSLNASFPVVEELSNWTRWYAAINAANLFIERIPEVKEKDLRYTDNNMKLDVAQARFLRAFAYFYMVRIWGDVPFIITSHDGNFEKMPRESKEKVLAWVEKELLAAAADLPYIYSDNDPQQQGNYYNEDRTRWEGALARKTSAYAILAHVAAWQGNYADVSKYSKFVTDNFGKSAMSWVSTDDLTRGNGFFDAKRFNHLLGFNSDYGHEDGSTTGHIEELTLAEPVVTKKVPDIYMVKDSILNIFNEADDQRFSLDTLGNPRNTAYFSNYNGRYPIFSKIKSIQGGQSDPNFRYFTSPIVFTRLEDIALLRAEALATLGETAGAIEVLNIIRQLRGLKAYDQNINGDLIDAIFKERQRELMGEGHRWYDLVRYNKIKGTNTAFTNLIRTGGIYWPVSRKVLQQNNLLTQNPYWK